MKETAAMATEEEKPDCAFSALDLIVSNDKSSGIHEMDEREVTEATNEKKVSTKNEVEADDNNESEKAYNKLSLDREWSDKESNVSVGG